MPLKNRIVIVLYGIDGSGKTTIARSLAYLLIKRSYKIELIRLRSHHTLVYVIMRLVLWMKRLDYKSLQGKPLYLDSIIMHFVRNKVLYMMLELVSVVLWFIFRLTPILISSRFNKTLIIADRYVPDFAVNLAIASGIKDQTMVKICLFLERLQPLKPFYFYVYTRPEQAVQRKKDEQLTKFFCEYMDLKYKYLSRYLRPTVLVDTSKHRIQDSVFIVLKELEKYCLVT